MRLKDLITLCAEGEWFNEDTEAVISQALQTGAGPNVSEAYTINGLPGPLYNCSAQGRIFRNFVKAQSKLAHFKFDRCFVAFQTPSSSR